MQSPSSTGSVCPSGSTLTYGNFGHGFMQTYCTRCHSQFASLGNIQADADNIDSYAAAGPTAVNTSMPKGSSVALSERQKLGEWLACGAP